MLTLRTAKFLKCKMPAPTTHDWRLDATIVSGVVSPPPLTMTRRTKAKSQLHHIQPYHLKLLHKSNDIKPSTALFKDTTWKKKAYSWGILNFRSLPQFSWLSNTCTCGQTAEFQQISRIQIDLPGDLCRGSKQFSPSPLSVFSPWFIESVEVWLLQLIVANFAKLKSTMSKAPPG